ncbi:hypothetical protein POG22_07245 [Geitlerinema sp. CS-897]|nr:hypothetical protein [Geitlerinema sp. CS-897]
MRSRIVTEGDARTPNRAMLRAVGFGDEDFSKPIVGVANGFSLTARSPALYPKGQCREE